jgi:hypothetical protein
MAYETGTAASADDLIDRLDTFAAANGWTVDFNGTWTSGRATLINRGGLHFGFYSDNTAGTTTDPGPRIIVRTYPGPYVGASAPQSQANLSSANVYSNNMPSPLLAYYFYALGDYIHVVVEAFSPSFRHFGVGRLQQVGAYTDGAYCHAARWSYQSSSPQQLWQPGSSHHAIPFDDQNSSGNTSQFGTCVRVDLAATPEYWYTQNTRNTRLFGGFRRSSTTDTSTTHPYSAFGNALIDMRPSEITGRAILVPATLAVPRGSSKYSFIGAPPDLRFVRIDNLNPGEVLTVGTDEWVCFPVRRKGTAAGQEASGNYGYAYRRVT